MIIRCEKAKDVAQIRDLLNSVFHSSSEADFIDQLRSDGNHGQSFVSCEGTQIVGHCRISSLIAPANVLFLGPLTVSKRTRRMGIGKDLVLAALEWASDAGQVGVFVFGNPRFYQKLGFSSDAARGFRSSFSGPLLMFKSLDGTDPATLTRKLELPPAFSVF